MSHPLECELVGDGQPSSTDAVSTSREIGDQRLLTSLRSQIRLSEAFSGVKFDDVSWEITHKGMHCRCLTDCSIRSPILVCTYMYSTT